MRVDVSDWVCTSDLIIYAHSIAGRREGARDGGREEGGTEGERRDKGRDV